MPYQAGPLARLEISQAAPHEAARLARDIIADVSNAYARRDGDKAAAMILFQVTDNVTSNIPLPDILPLPLDEQKAEEKPKRWIVQKRDFWRGVIVGGWLLAIAHRLLEAIG